MKNFVIIGNSAAGTSAVEAIREKDTDSKITIVSDEDYNSYYRCLISYFLAGEIPQEKLVHRPEDFYKENNLNLILNKQVIKVDPRKNRIVLEDKTLINYDVLLIATGVSAKFPAGLKGLKKAGVFGFRTINDVRGILNLTAVSSSSCVLGGGLIGLNAAYGLVKRHQELKVIVKSRYILSRMLDERAAGLFMSRFRDSGIEIMTQGDIIEILGNGDLKAVKLDSGKIIACSILVIDKGVNPNTDLIKDAQIKRDRGILVDLFMKTNIPNIFAAGDVVQSLDAAYNNSVVNAFWPNAIEQGRVAGLNMIEQDVQYEGSIAMNSIEFFGLPAISMGVIRPEGPGFEELVFFDEKKNIYKKFILEGNHLVGMIAVGDIINCGGFLSLIRKNVDISAVKDELISETFSYARILDLLKEKDRVTSSATI